MKSARYAGLTPRFCREMRRMLCRFAALAIRQSCKPKRYCKRWLKGAAAERSVPVKAIRLIVAFAAIGLVTGEARAAPASDANAPQPAQTQPTPKLDKKSDKTAKPTQKPETHKSEVHKSEAHKSEAHKSEAHKSEAHKSDKSAKPTTKSEKAAKSAHKSDKKAKPTAHTTAKTAPGPMLLSVPSRPVTSTASVPPSGVISSGGADVPRSAPPFTPSTIPLRRSTAAPPPRRRAPRRRWRWP